AVRIDQTFSDNDQAVLLAGERALDVLENFLRGERNFGQTNNMGRIVWMILPFSQSGARSDPPGTAAHYFKNGNEVARSEAGIVASHLAHGRGDVFDHTSVTRAMVRDDEVVIDRLRNTDHAQIVVPLVGQFGYFVGRILGIIAA